MVSDESVFLEEENAVFGVRAAFCKGHCFCERFGDARDSKMSMKVCCSWCTRGGAEVQRTRRRATQEGSPGGLTREFSLGKERLGGRGGRQGRGGKGRGNLL